MTSVPAPRLYEEGLKIAAEFAAEIEAAEKRGRRDGGMHMVSNVLSVIARLAAGAGTYGSITRTATPIDDVVDAVEALRQQGRTQGIETMRVALRARASAFRECAERLQDQARFTLLDRADCLDAAASQLGRP